MKVFISHSRQDEELAMKVAAALKEAGLDVLNGEIMPGVNWAEKIAMELNESDAMVVLLTPHALSSDFVRSDINFALSEKKYNKRLIPVFVGELEDYTQVEIPWILKRLKPLKLSDQGKNKENLQQIAQALKEVA
jgi:hypothetical protein